MWGALDLLLTILVRDSSFASLDVLLSWKGDHHLANAREPYAWRSAIEEIKNSDLRKKCESVDQDRLVVITDRPLMLKIAGEVTNALFHSYNTGHRLSFNESK